MTRSQGSSPSPTQVHQGPVSKVPLSSWILLAALVGAVVLLGVLNWAEARHWREARSAVAAIDQQTAQAVAEWEALKLRQLLLTNRRLMLCNPSADNVRIDDVLAIYEQDGNLRQFNSRACPNEWARFGGKLPAGSKRVMDFSTTNAACNWSGEFLFASVSWYTFSQSGEPFWRRIHIHPLLLTDKECLALAI